MRLLPEAGDGLLRRPKVRLEFDGANLLAMPEAEMRDVRGREHGDDLSRSRRPASIRC
jgi:ABC-type microcin C transport system duplicated ATPase subunit YejF